MLKKDFFYDLPQSLIAQHPVHPRDHSRLMYADRSSGEIVHDHFYNIANYFQKGDLLIINDSRVIPARLYGTPKNNSSKIEILLLEEKEKDVWEILCKPGKKFKIESEFNFGDKLHGKIIEILEDGNRLIRLSYNGSFYDILNKIGHMPLPPYIKEKLENSESYQTVYSNKLGSCAAPTAGLHFTNNLLDEVASKGVNIAKVTLNVGIGTFKSVQTENIEDHVMHKEYYELSRETVDLINKTKLNSKRVFAVGTTSLRVLEGTFDKFGCLKPCKTHTDIFIYPGFKFNVIDGIITNFHLPQSSLIMLISAFLGYENTMNAYKTAISNNYRFFSFGDAMIIK